MFAFTKVWLKVYCSTESPLTKSQARSQSLSQAFSQTFVQSHLKLSIFQTLFQAPSQGLKLFLKLLLKPLGTSITLRKANYFYADVDSMVDVVNLIVGATVYPSCTADQISTLQDLKSTIEVKKLRKNRARQR